MGLETPADLRFKPISAHSSRVTQPSYFSNVHVPLCQIRIIIWLITNVVVTGLQYQPKMKQKTILLLFLLIITITLLPKIFLGYCYFGKFLETWVSPWMLVLTTLAAYGIFTLKKMDWLYQQAPKSTWIKTRGQTAFCLQNIFFRGELLELYPL